MDHALRRWGNQAVLETIGGYHWVKGGHVEHLNTLFNMTALHCYDRSWSFLKLSDCSIYLKHVFSITVRHRIKVSMNIEQSINFELYVICQWKLPDCLFYWLATRKLS